MAQPLTWTLAQPLDGALIDLTDEDLTRMWEGAAREDGYEAKGAPTITRDAEWGADTQTAKVEGPVRCVDHKAHRAPGRVHVAPPKVCPHCGGAL